jgi:hypothetical protein
MLPISNIFKRYKITDSIRSIEFGTTTNKIATRNPVEFSTGTTTCSKLLLDRTHSTRLHYFLQRKRAVHPRLVSTAQQDNMDQVGLIGISLPKSHVMLDQVLICTGQSQGRVEGSTRSCWMKERIPLHKTSSFCQNGLPSAIPLRD